MTSPSFADLGVSEPLRRALHTQRYVNPTPIQAQAVPVLLAGKDLLGVAQTGSGKTAAFALPILQRLAAQPLNPGPRRTRALILAPTRELAIQIGDDCKTYGRHLNLRYALIFGGVGQAPQVKAMAKGVDILVATPGRLLDLMSQDQVRLDKVSILVLDEADRMLDMGFIPDVRRIVSTLPRERQSLMFSATMPSDVAKIAADFLHQPVRVDVSPATVTVDRVDQRVLFVAAPDKRAVLVDLLTDPALARVIVFTRTKHGANRLTQQLENAGVTARAIHGNKSQGARQQALESFRAGSARVLVATDIAARGIDVDGVTHVINYELPNVPESYVHRIGRTARAGASGIALSLCDPSERPLLREIEKLTCKAVPIDAAHPLANRAALGSPAVARNPRPAGNSRRTNTKAQRRPAPRVVAAGGRHAG